MFLIDTRLKINDDFLPALKFVLDWFVRSKMIKKLYTALYTDDIHFYDKDSGNVTFFCNEMASIRVFRRHYNTTKSFFLEYFFMSFKFAFFLKNEDHAGNKNPH